MITVYVTTLVVFVAAWTAAWFAYIRPLLRRYATTTRLLDRVAAAEHDSWTRLALWFEGKKTVLVAMVTSAVAAAKAAADQAAGLAAGVGASLGAGLTPDTLAPLQDKGLWAAFFGDVWTLRIIAALGLLTAFLTLRGKVAAARLVPADATKGAASTTGGA